MRPRPEAPAARLRSRGLVGSVALFATLLLLDLVVLVVPLLGEFVPIRRRRAPRTTFQQPVPNSALPTDDPPPDAERPARPGWGERYRRHRDALIAAAEQPRQQAPSLPRRARYRQRRDALVAAAQVRRGSRKRGLVMAVGGFAALAALFQAVSANVLAVNFTTANTPFKLYTNYLQGEEVAAYLNNASRQDGTNLPVAELGIKKASLAGLCLIANEKVLGVPYSVVLTAGEPVSSTFTYQTDPAITDDDYYLPTGWASGEQVWGSGGDTAQGQYVGALKGRTAADAITATNLYLNTTSLTGAGYKLSGLYLGERAEDVGANAGVSWETGAGSAAPVQGGGNFGLRVDHLNLGGAAIEQPGTPAVPGTPDVTTTSSDGPATIVKVASNYPETNNSSGEGLGSVVDGLPATKWYTAHSAVYATYTLSQPYQVTSYTLTSGNDSPDRDPYNFTLQGSNDNSAWTTVDTVANNTFAARTTAYTFTVDSPGVYKYYKLNVTKTAGTSSNGGGSAFQLSEWGLGGVGLAGNTFSGSSAGSNNQQNFRFLADGDPATKWYADSFTSPTTITYTMSSPVKVINYTMTTGADSGTSGGENGKRDPRDWKVQGSNDNSAWTDLDTETNQAIGGTNGGNNAVQTYTVANPGTYKYYRLTITATRRGTTGSSSHVQLADWTLGTGTVTTTTPGTPGTPAGDSAGGSYGLRLKGSITLPHLKIKIVPGNKGQSYCTTAAQ